MEESPPSFFKAATDRLHGVLRLIRLLKQHHKLVRTVFEDKRAWNLREKHGKLNRNPALGFRGNLVIDGMRIDQHHARKFFARAITLPHILHQRALIEKPSHAVEVCLRIFQHQIKQNHPHRRTKTNEQQLTVKKLDQRRAGPKKHPEENCPPSARIDFIFLSKHDRQCHNQEKYCKNVCCQHARTIRIEYHVVLVPEKIYRQKENHKRPDRRDSFKTKGKSAVSLPVGIGEIGADV